MLSEFYYSAYLKRRGRSAEMSNLSRVDPFKLNQFICPDRIRTLKLCEPSQAQTTLLVIGGGAS
jgi:hypothetical protein